MLLCEKIANENMSQLKLYALLLCEMIAAGKTESKGRILKYILSRFNHQHRINESINQSMSNSSMHIPLSFLVYLLVQFHIMLIFIFPPSNPKLCPRLCMVEKPLVTLLY
mmetsp:Transcript_8075/g.12042  ORF Transcript_8075/g.12042 Transcript_8075/m.12042 type:complete len:110 (-) Transcript_8075:139-468(-)